MIAIELMRGAIKRYLPAIADGMIVSSKLNFSCFGSEIPIIFMDHLYLNYKYLSSEQK